MRRSLPNNELTAPEASSRSVDLRSTARRWSVGGAAGDERAGVGRGLLAILVERRLQAREGAVTAGKADAVNSEVVDEAGVEDVRRVAAVAHARRGLLGDAQQRAERGDIFREHRLVAQVRGNL